MNLEKYLEQERQVRGGVHLSGGVWWRPTSLGRCEPLYPLQPVVPIISFPRASKSYLGYRHLTRTGSEANSSAAFMMLRCDALRAFDFRELPHDKRKAVNKACRSGLAVRRMTDLEGYWGDLHAIYVSTARRTQYGLPEEYYSEKSEEWKRKLRIEFALPERDWLGAFAGGTLVGFMYSTVVGDVASLLVTKFNADHLDARPSDALHYHVLCLYRDSPTCSEVCAGPSQSMVPSIDRFKRGFGLEEVTLPAYCRVNEIAKAVIGTGLACVSRLVRRQSPVSKRNLRYRVEMLSQSLARW